MDLGRTMPGTVTFESDAPRTATISIETGEALLPTRTYNVMREETRQRTKFTPRIAHGGWGSFRFVWIHFENVVTPFTIWNPLGMLQIYPANYIGDFACSDTDLTGIWEMCSYSAHAVMGQPSGKSSASRPILQTLCLDRIDRFPWAGDSRVIQTVVESVFGTYDLVRAALENLLPANTRPIPDLTNIPPYTLDWALSVVDYYKVSGDIEYLKRRLPDLLEIARKYDGPVPKEEFVDNVPVRGWLFFDWDKRINDPFRRQEEFRDQRAGAFTGKFVQTCRALAWAAGTAGDGKLGATFHEIGERHAKKWLKENSVWRERYSIHAITNLLLGGVLQEKDYEAAFRAVYRDRLGRCTGTPYFGGYVLNALALIGKHREAVELLHDYWGTMIAAGATTTWEEWHPDVHLPVNAQPPQYAGPVNRAVAWGGLSLIQPAGAGPARWLLDEILGVSPAAPGFRRVRIQPHTVGLSWARGTVASPLGPISVHWRKSPDRFALTFKVPRECERVTVYVQPHGSYSLDGRTIVPPTNRSGLAAIEANSGEHRLECAGKPRLK
jgi:hypothetical protein